MDRTVSLELETLQTAAALHEAIPPPENGAQPAAQDEEIPPLENGDRLTRPEFERRYEAMPQVKKAELIEGIVHMPSPVRANHHGSPHALVLLWLGIYRASTPGVALYDNSTFRLDLDNEPQPDALLRIAEGGRSRLDEDDYVEGPPELVVEVASSSVSVDLHDKLQAYRRNGVQEYAVWQIRDRRLRWFELRKGRYHELAPGKDGVVRSRVFPGLWLKVQPLLAEDWAAVLLGAQEGLASPEHAAFLARLKPAASTETPAS